MKNKLPILTLAALSLGLTACEPSNDSSLPPGRYESTRSTTDAAGTTYETQRTTKVEEDEDGDRKTTVKSKTTRDPEGLFNKKTTESTRTYEEDRY